MSLMLQIQYVKLENLLPAKLQHGMDNFVVVFVITV